MQRLILPAILPFMILLLACNEEVKQEKLADRDTIRKELTDQWEAFIASWEREDAGGCAAIYTENAQNIPPNADILKGRKAIEEFYEFLFSNNLRSEYAHNIESLDFFDNAVLEQGNFQVNWLANDSSETIFLARSLTHWKKTGKGWKIERIMFNQPGD